MSKWFFIIFFLISAELSAQIPAFEKLITATYPIERGTDMVQLQNGTIFLLGIAVNGPFGGKDVALLKFSPSGNLLAEWYYGTPDSEYPNSLLLSENELVIVGETTNLTTIKKSGLILKTDTLGNQLSLNIYSKPSANLQFNKGVLEGDQVIVTGFISGATGFGNDVYVAAFGESQDDSWELIYGDSTNEVGNAIQKFPSGNYVVTCDLQRADGKYNAMAFCVSPRGSLIWEKDFANTHNGGTKNMIINQTGNALMVGEMSTPTSDAFDMYYAEINDQGESVREGWLAATEMGEAAFGIAQGSNSDYLFAGYGKNPQEDFTSLSVFLADENGHIKGRKYFGNGLINIGYSVIDAQSDGFYATGFYYEQGTPHGILIYDSFGNSTKVEETNQSNKFFKSLEKQGDKISLFLQREFNIAQFSIWNLSGKQVVAHKENRQTNQLNFNTKLSNQIFVLKVEFEDGSIGTHKFWIP